MRREELVDLNAFATVAEERSFTRAAAKLGTSQSALSHTINRLEARVGVRRPKKYAVPSSSCPLASPCSAALRHHRTASVPS